MADPAYRQVAHGGPHALRSQHLAGMNGAAIAPVVRDLPVSRIGHGVRASEDPALVEELARRGVVLEVCPGSNVALGLYPDRAAHPLRRLIAAGVRVTLGSDDPPFFHTTLKAEYDQAGLDERALLKITRTAIQASFAEASVKQRLLEGV